MPTTRRKVLRQPKAEHQIPSDWVDYYLHGYEPDLNYWDFFLDVWLNSREHELWEEIKGDLLPQFIRKNPGKRPYGWWLFDGPRTKIKNFDLIRPRRQVSGIGTRAPDTVR